MSDYEYDEEVGDGWSDSNDDGSGNGDQEESISVKIENLMYMAENADSDDQALEKYEEVLALERENSINENTFKCLEKITILAGQLGDFEKSKKHNSELLDMTETWGRNDVNEAIQNII